VRLTTSAGQCRARRVLIAIDSTGKTPADDPWPVRRLTVALETDPLSDDIASAMGWHQRQPFYTNSLPLLWGRSMPGGGLLAGRELLPIEMIAAVGLREAIDIAGVTLTARVRGLHASLSSIGVRRVWAGPIAREESGIPRLLEDPRVPNVWWAGGYGGHGLAQAFRLGQTAAVRLAD
jgi:glycine/D-amino acid oxidase-like deaminating enzyme